MLGSPKSREMEHGPNDRRVVSPSPGHYCPSQADNELIGAWERSSDSPSPRARSSDEDCDAISSFGYSDTVHPVNKQRPTLTCGVFGQLQPQESSSETELARSSHSRSRVSPPSSVHSSSHGGLAGGSASGSGAPPEQDKKMRREIANSNERRRMMCINNGFVNLQMILPKHYMKRGEKMSKAAVLQSTVDYIGKLVSENGKLHSKNEALLQKINSSPSRPNEPAAPADHCIAASEQQQSGERPLSGSSRSRSANSSINPNSPASAKDLVNMVQQWRERYNRERLLRTQVVQEFRRLEADLQFCPVGCGKRQKYAASLLLHRAQSPVSPDHTEEEEEEEEEDLRMMTMMVAAASHTEYTKGEQSTTTTANGSSSSLSPCHQAAPGTPSATGGAEEDEQAQRETPVLISIPDYVPLSTGAGGGASYGKRKRPSSGAVSTLTGTAAGMEEANLKPKVLTGFEILYQAITFSEGNLDGNRSDSGCSEETFDSADPPRKRHRQKAKPHQPQQQQQPLSAPNSMERVCS